MSGDVDKTVVDQVIDQDRAGVDPADLRQPALFPEVVAAMSAARRGPRGRGRRGRPAGSRNRRAEEYARLVLQAVQDKGSLDPLQNTAQVAGTDLLNESELQRVARIWGCSRFEAAKFIAKLGADVNPYLHQALPRALILQPGAPGAERVVVELDGDEYHEVARAGADDELEPEEDDTE